MAFTKMSTAWPGIPNKGSNVPHKSVMARTIENLTSERDHWRARFHDELVDKKISAGATRSEANDYADAAVARWAKAFRQSLPTE